MKAASDNSTGYIVRFETGEEFISGITAFARKQRIKGAWFWAIGAADRMELAFYDLKKRRYIRRKFAGRFEIIGITGSVAIKDGVPVVHAHGVFSKPNLAAIGGHIFSCRISATCEVYLRKLQSLRRDYDTKTGLNLLKF